MSERLRMRLARIWRGLRQASGDDAYERYLEHWREHHAGAGARPMDRKTFYATEQERKWSGVNRCC